MFALALMVLAADPTPADLDKRLTVLEQRQAQTDKKLDEILAAVKGPQPKAGATFAVAPTQSWSQTTTATATGACATGSCSMPTRRGLFRRW